MDTVKFTSFLYGKLPSIYRKKDAELGYPLLRYITAICNGGFGQIIDKEQGILGLLDPYTCPKDCLEFLCSNAAIKYYPDMQEKYLRRLLANAAELRKRIGTYSYFRYLVSTITGMETRLKYVRGLNTEVEGYETQSGRWLNITLLAQTLEEAVRVSDEVVMLRPLVQDGLPFYIKYTLMSEVEVQVLDSAKHATCPAITYAKTYKLIPA